MQSSDKTTLDAWVLAELDRVIGEVTTGYETYHYRPVRDALFNFCNETLSAIYLAAIKDRLYCDAKNSSRRRRCQTTLYKITDALVRLMAPILVHTADEAYLALKKADVTANISVHLESLPQAQYGHSDEAWQKVLQLRHIALQHLEQEKATQGFTNPLDVGVMALLPKTDYETLQHYGHELADLCGVSQFKLEIADSSKIVIKDLRQEPKCVRSWKRDGTVKQHAGGHWLSERDAHAVGMETTATT